MGYDEGCGDETSQFKRGQRDGAFSNLFRFERVVCQSQRQLATLAVFLKSVRESEMSKEAGLDGSCQRSVTSIGGGGGGKRGQRLEVRLIPLSRPLQA